MNRNSLFAENLEVQLKGSKTGLLHKQDGHETVSRIFASNNRASAHETWRNADADIAAGARSGCVNGYTIRV